MSDKPTPVYQVAQILSKLGTERRCKIMRVLIDAEEPVSSSMIATLIDCSESATSFNLTTLLNAGLVIKIPSGRWAFYLVNPVVLTIITDFFKPQETDDECSGTS